MARTPQAIRLGSLSIDPVTLGSQGNAVLGIRGSGKTYTATFLAEQLHDAGIPFIAFDPIGVWRFLRVPGAGKGYPVVVAGGADGDLPLTVASAPEIVRAAMSSGLSLVIDLFDMNLSKADWKRIVMSCVRVLLHENSKHGLRHIFLEEAAEFAPQMVSKDNAHVYAEIEKLARMGGNSRLGYTLINQRAEEVNKAVLELCDNLFLHRQKGRNSLTALSKWLSIGNAANGKEITDSMATLPTGECWAWLGEEASPVLVNVPAKNSLHPDRTVMRGDVAIKSQKAVDVGSFVESMKATLVKFQVEADANDPVKLKRRIAELEKAKPVTVSVPAPVDPKLIEAAEARGYERGVEAGKAAGLAEAKTRLQALADALPGLPVAVAARPAPALRQSVPKVAPAPVKREAPVRAAAPIGEFNGPQMKVLRSLAMWKALGKDTPSKPMVAMCAGYSHSSGGFANLLGTLRTMGAIEYPTPGAVQLLTDAAAMDASEGRELFRGKLSGPQRKIVDALAAGGEMSKAELGEATDYSPTSGGFANLLGQLRTLGILDYPQPGRVAMEPWVFDVL